MSTDWRARTAAAVPDIMGALLLLLLLVVLLLDAPCCACGWLESAVVDLPLPLLCARCSGAVAVAAAVEKLDMPLAKSATAEDMEEHDVDMVRGGGANCCCCGCCCDCGVPCVVVVFVGGELLVLCSALTIRGFNCLL